jgi:MYXO-CTERM domain-containing protein
LVIGEDVELSARLRQIGQVVLDPQMVVQTSGRRYRAGLGPGLLTYAPSTVMRLVFRQERFLWFSDVRDETPAPVWPLLAALLLVVMLLQRRRRTT